MKKHDPVRFSGATYFAVLMLLWLAHTDAFAQEPANAKPGAFHYGKAISLNMTPLATVLLPFNRFDPLEAGPFSLRFRGYGPRKRTAFRFSLGVKLSDDFEDARLALALGFEKRHALGSRWAYTAGMDALLFGGSLNLPGANENVDGATFGLGPHWGIEYFLHERISVGAEALLVLGFSVDEEVVNFQVVPPVGVFLTHYF